MLNIGKKSLLFGMKKVYPYATGGDYVYLYEEDGKTYRVHVFLTSGTNTLNVEVGGKMNIFLVGGGGGGGHGGIGSSGMYSNNYVWAGGGGGGGVLELEPYSALSSQTLTFEIGAGGTGGVNGYRGDNGGNTTFNGLTAYGGGGGGGGRSNNFSGNNGGAGGGASVYGCCVISVSGSQNGGSGVSGQGYEGGLATGNNGYGGGGGGAGSSGNANNVASNKGVGGSARVIYGLGFGGGGGAGAEVGGAAGGRNAGRGASSRTPGYNATNGVDGYGGGGGGGAFYNSGNGFLPGNGGNGGVVVAYVVAEKKLWTPSELTGLQAWYDASDETTITLNGSNVSQWSDKSGNGKHAIQNNSSLQPAYTVGGLNNKNVVTLTQDEMDVTNLVLVNQGHEVYTIATFESTSNNWARLFSFRTTGQSNDYNNSTSWIPILRNAAQTQIGAYQSSGTTYYTITYGTPMLLSSTISNGLTVRVDSVIRATKATSTNLNTTDGLKIGQSLQTADENWDGLVAEIVFTDELSLTDRQKMEGYLAHKWGLTNNLPAGHPYKYEPPYKVEPEEIVTDGLVLNLDAGDYASYPRSGTTWYDISGNGNNGTLTNGPTYDSANKGSIVFDGTNDYVLVGNDSSNQITTSLTLEAWVYPTQFSHTNIKEVIAKWDNKQYKLAIAGTIFGVPYGTFYIDVSDTGSNDNYRRSSSTLTLNSWNHIVGVYTSGASPSLNVYLNGTLDNGNLVGSVPSSMYNGTSPVYIGSHEGRAFKGNIANVRIYNRALSSTEISQNFNALRGRYGI